MKSIAIALAFTTACAAPPAEDVTVQGLKSLNGKSLNGTSLNGTSLNGKSLNGTSLNGVSLEGAPLDLSVVGSTWVGTASNGVTVPLRIDAATSSGTLNFYTVSYQTSTGWSPLCVDATGLPVAAIAVPGTWDATASYAASSTSFTFACRFKSIAKCVEMGYVPWIGYADYMAGCVRLLRADYCGTGVSYTADGTLINLYDSAGIQLDTEMWGAEAEWTPAGARCVNVGNSRFANVAPSQAPPCFKTLSKGNGCGDFADGGLLIDELPPPTYTNTNASTTSMTTAVH